LSHLSDFTVRKIAKGWGRYLTWLDFVGMPCEPAAPDERITPARVRDYVAALERYNATGTIISRLEELAQAARVMCPHRDCSWIYRTMARVQARHIPAKPKRPRLVGIGVLFDRGLELMERARSVKAERHRLITYRDGLLIATLAARQMRIRNLAGLALGRSILRRGAEWWIDIEADDTKTKEAYERHWPEDITRHLEYYLAEIRPALAARRGRWTRPVGDALWLSTDGSPMSIKSIYERIVLNTGINPHLFRDCAVTSVEIEDPFHVGITPHLLAHRTSSTTYGTYNHARAIEACRLVQAFLLSLRTRRFTSRPSPPRSKTGQSQNQLRRIRARQFDPVRSS
jgi:integrase/recombinase XerD